LRDHGLDEDQLFEVLEIAAVFNFTNRLSSAIGGRPDPDFFELARPRRQLAREPLSRGWAASRNPTSGSVRTGRRLSCGPAPTISARLAY
jgi:hypothetical protein